MASGASEEAPSSPVSQIAEPAWETRLPAAQLVVARGSLVRVSGAPSPVLLTCRTPLPRDTARPERDLSVPVLFRYSETFPSVSPRAGALIFTLRGPCPEQV